GRRGRQLGGRRHRLGRGGLGGCRRGGGLDRRLGRGGLGGCRRGGRDGYARRTGLRRAAARADILPALGAALRGGEERTGVEGPPRRRLHAALGLPRRGRRGGRPRSGRRGREGGRGGRGATRRAARIAAA